MIPAVGITADPKKAPSTEPTIAVCDLSAAATDCRNWFPDRRRPVPGSERQRSIGRVPHDRECPTIPAKKRRLSRL
jgi:hypothetical protein